MSNWTKLEMEICPDCGDDVYAWTANPINGHVDNEDLVRCNTCGDIGTVVVIDHDDLYDNTQQVIILTQTN